MKFVITGRAGGKTTKAVEWVKEHPYRVLVVHSAEEAQRIAREYGVHRSQLMSADQVRNGRLRGKQAEVGVENVDMMLAWYLGQPPEFVTATGELV